jgi:hypothetical protein
MPIVASALRGHDVFSSKSRGRSRAASEVGPLPPVDGEKKPERAQLPKAASYTYFPRVKSLDGDAPAHESEEDLKKGKDVDITSDSSSGGSSPSSEEAPQALEMPQLRPERPASTTRRSSRFLPFSSKSREPSIEPKPERNRKEAVKESESPSASPSRSLTKLRRKSWVQQQQQQPPTATSPTKESKKEKKAAHKEEAKKKVAASEAPKRKTPASTDSIPEEAAVKDEARDEAQDVVEPIPLTKKNRRLSALLTANGPAVPSVPKSFSTEQLPLYPHSESPLSSTNIVPPLPRNISTDKLGNKVKTEPRKKDELWTVFRTLEGELRKYVDRCLRSLQAYK